MEGDDESLIAHGGNLKFSNNQPYTHGVKEDINELLRQTVELFDENETLRISYFQKVWHDMKFGLIFVIVLFFVYIHFCYQTIQCFLNSQAVSINHLVCRSVRVANPKAYLSQKKFLN